MAFRVRSLLRRAHRSAASLAGGSPFELPDLQATRRANASRTIGVLVYEGVTTVEVDEPVRRLASRLDADVVFIGRSRGPLVGIEPVRMVQADHSLDDEMRVDVLVLPGGLGWRRIADDAAAMQWLSDAVECSSGVLTMSTGSLLLAAAGQLVGKQATGHWLARHDLAELGAQVSTARSTATADQRIITTAGARAALAVCEDFADRLRWGP